MVLDFSTIDHVGEWNQVIDEYTRVLKPKGVLGIAFWGNNHFREDDNYVFDIEVVKAYLVNLGWTIVEEEVIEKTTDKLVWLLCI